MIFDWHLYNFALCSEILDLIKTFCFTWIFLTSKWGLEVGVALPHYYPEDLRSAFYTEPWLTLLEVGRSLLVLGSCGKLRSRVASLPLGVVNSLIQPQASFDTTQVVGGILITARSRWKSSLHVLPSLKPLSEDATLWLQPPFSFVGMAGFGPLYFLCSLTWGSGDCFGRLSLSWFFG